MSGILSNTELTAAVNQITVAGNQLTVALGQLTFAVNQLNSEVALFRPLLESLHKPLVKGANELLLEVVRKQED